jgi:D-glycero-D-manno-heptose 1,7-bisphosphate phosphatase
VQSALFLDRDGVIIENRENYVRSWGDVTFIPAAISALKRIAPLDVKVVIVTNQACVNKGIITLEQAKAINARIIREVMSAGGRIDAAYLCPHRHDEACGCRKPAPGMLFRAARDHLLDLRGSWMVGDAVTDMQAARAAGVRGVLVRTGRGVAERLALEGEPWFTDADNLEDAIAPLFSRSRMVS